MKKLTGEKTLLCLLVVVVVSFLVRLLVAQKVWVNMDEGNFMCDAFNLLSGGIPYRHFLAREPLFLILTTIFLWFRNDLLGGRLLSVSAGSLTVLLLYVAGNQLYGKKTGLAAAVIFAFSPQVIFFSAIMKTEIIEGAFLSAAMVCLILGMKSLKLRYFFLDGVLVGVSALCGRVSGIFLFLQIPFLVYWVKNKANNRTLATVVSFVVGSVLSLGLAAFWLLLFVDLKWLYLALGGGGIEPIFQSLQAKGNVVAFGFLALSHIIIPALAYPIISKTGRSHWMKFVYWIMSFFCLLVVVVAYSGVVIGYGTFLFPPAFLPVYLLLVVVSLISVYSMTSHRSSVNKHQLKSCVLYMWLLGFVFFYTVYGIKGWIFFDYWYAFTPSLSMMAGVVITSLSLTQFRRIAIAFLIIALALFPCYVYSPLNPYNTPYEDGVAEQPWNLYERTYSPGFVSDVARYLNIEMAGDSQAFTADMIFLAASHRQSIFNLSYFNYYKHANKPFPYDPYHLFPSIAEIIERLRDIDYVVIGFRTGELFQRHPDLAYYVAFNYALIKRFGELDHINQVSIFKREVPSITNVTIWFRHGMNESLEEVRGTWYIADGVLENTEGFSYPLRSLVVCDVGRFSNVWTETTLGVRGEGGIVLLYRDEGNYLCIRLIKSPDFEGLNVLEKIDYQDTSLAWYSFPLSNRTYNLGVALLSTTVEVYLDGERVLEANRGQLLSGKIGLVANYGAQFFNLSVSTDLQTVWRRVSLDR